MAKFEPGHAKIPGSGNQKGSVTTKNILAMELLSGENCPLKNAIRILKESGELTDNERLQGWTKLIEYVASKRKAIEVTSDDETKKALTLAYANPKHS